MKLLKKLDVYMLKNFLGLFFMTFAICCFILLMQLIWMRINDIVGKGVGVDVLMEFLFYAFLGVVPMALPLAILLASLMTFGNLGEKFELTAMKAAGISLFRIMRPLTVFIAMVSVGAFFFSNYVLPQSQLKFWTLVFSLRQKSPELDIPQGEFYPGVTGYNIYVQSKDAATGLLRGVMIYDYSRGFQDATVTVADSGRLYFTDDRGHLLLRLYSGESFENLDRQAQRAAKADKSVPYRREMFGQKSLLIDFNSQFVRLDESVLRDQHVSKDVRELVESIDSISVLAAGRSREQSDKLRDTRYLGREHRAQKVLAAVEEDDRRYCDPDSIYAHFSREQKIRALDYAIKRAGFARDVINYNGILLEDYQRYMRKHSIELHRKFTLAFACLIFFFIGAPLGAIIRKGGLGAPVVISVALFIIYYIIDNAGYKMAREALWPVWEGMWLSSFVLLPIGIFLTYKAATDSGLFNTEVWIKEAERLSAKAKQYMVKLKNRYRK